MVLTEDLKRRTANYLAAIASKLVSRYDDSKDLLQVVRDSRKALRTIEGALEEVTNKGTANHLNNLLR